MKLGKIIFFFGLAIMLFAATVMMLNLIMGSATANVVKGENIIPVTGEATSLPIEPTAMPNLTQTPQPTPTAIPVVSTFVFGQKVDLSSGKPTVLLVLLPDGNMLPSTWAKSVTYQEKDSKSVFLPGNGIIYSYEDDGLPITWAHSGLGYDGTRFFATDLEIFLRKNAEGKVMSWPEAQIAGEKLIGQTAVLCQEEADKVKALTKYDPSTGCAGKKVILEVVAFTIVPREQVAEYDKVVLGFRQWMADNFPNTGFDKLSSSDSWVVRFCMGKFADQADDGTPGYLFNRGVIAFRVRE